MNKISIFLSVLVSLLFLSGCDNGSGIDQTFNRSGETLDTTVVFYDTREELDRSYSEQYDAPLNEGRVGYAVWHNPSSEPHHCEIHVLKPNRADDNRMDTMGHELAHCVLGKFHAGTYY